jgi:ATP-binding cassette subfamily B protein RaxB
LGRSLCTVFGLALALELFGLLSPQFLQLVVDQVLADNDHDLLKFIGISFGLLVLLQTTVTALRTWSVLWISTHFSLNWTGNVFQHLLKLPHSWFLKRNLGDIVSRFGAISTIQRTLTTRFVEVVLDGLMTILTAAVMCVYSPLLTAVTASALIIYAGLRILYYRVYRESNLSQIVVQARQQTNFLEAVRGVQTLQLFNHGTSRSARYMNLTADALNTGIAVQKLSLIFSAFQGTTTGLQKVALLWVGAWLALKGEFSAGMLMAYVAYADQFTSRSMNLVDYGIELRLLRIQSERLADIVLSPTEAHVEGTYVGPTPQPSIKFENVGFRYADGEPWIVRNCSFEILAGESVAITGPSGCGKTTVLRLILGLLDPEEGVITIGGIDIKHLGKTAYRSMLACVLQDDKLFAGSIAENIALFDERADMLDIERAAEQAELLEDIVAMPMGYHSLIGDMGSSLSGGQQQRLAIARALYRKPRILVMDEATSHLDIERERQILDKLKSLNVTRISVAHRPETIASADRILKLNSMTVEEIHSNS